MALCLQINILCLDEKNPYVDDKPKYEKDEKKGEYVIVNDYKNAKQNYNSQACCHSSTNVESRTCRKLYDVYWVFRF